MFKRIINKIQCIGKHGHGERNLRFKHTHTYTHPSNGLSRDETATSEVYEINNRLDMRVEKVQDTQQKKVSKTKLREEKANKKQ